MTGQDSLERIWRAVATIPRGRVESYGSVARRAGLPGRARLVGHALRVAPEELDLPWHRVVGAGGRISLPEGSPAQQLQRRRLQAEGVRFHGRTIAREARCDAAGLDEWLWGQDPPGDPGR